MTTTDWRDIPRVSDPARSPSQPVPLPLQKNGRAPLACERCYKRKQKVSPMPNLRVTEMIRLNCGLNRSCYFVPYVLAYIVICMDNWLIIAV